jgi:hypothetical protein
MKKSNLLAFLIMLLLSSISYTQNEELVKTTKNKLDSLKVAYELAKGSHIAQKDSLALYRTAISPSSKDQDFEKIKHIIGNINQLTKELNHIKKNADVYVDFYSLELKDNENKQITELVKYFRNIDGIEINDEKKDETTASKVLYYFGKNEVIAEEDTLFNDPKYDKIFKSVLSTESKSYLGDFIVPRDGQKLEIFSYKVLKERTLRKDKLDKEDLDKYEVKFKYLKIHVEQGLIQDIKIIVLDNDGNELLFENETPISLLKFSRKAPLNNMFFRTIMSNNREKPLNRDYARFRLKLSDVLMYINNPGENYIPDDLKLEFPTKTDGMVDNSEKSIRYKIEQNTSLENVLNLRAYTDFLGLFGDSPNGIVQIEGKSDFYLVPFNLPNSHSYLFKKVSPFIHYARLDNEQQNVVVENSTIVNSLEILEKSFLNMGLDLDVFSTKFRKEFPFEVTFYGTARYNISNVEQDENVSVNYKSLSLGGGLRVDIKRFNNFGLTLKSEVAKVNTNELNTLTFIENPNNFSVFRNEAEIFYHPAAIENQAVFLRLTTFGNSSAGSNEAFYQLQFGYRFSIGVSKLKQ